MRGTVISNSPHHHSGAQVARQGKATARRQPVRVSIDLETTGLQPETESIIEIAAVKFRGAEVLETFQTPVATNRPIPYRVRRLTGITPADLAHAPSFEQVAPKLRAFLGKAALVGHSVPFDAAFLRKQGLAQENPLLDTFELATVLLPDLPNYTLERVSAALGLEGDTFHRAMADAMLAKDVFLSLLARIEQLDMSVLEELEVLSGKLPWPLLALFAEERRARPRAATPASWGSLGAQIAAKRGINPQVFSLGIARVATSAAEPLAQARPSAGATPDVPTLPAALQPPPSVVAAIRNAFEAPCPLMLELEPDASSLASTLLTAIRQAQAQGKRLVIVGANAQACRKLMQETLPALQAVLPQPFKAELLASLDNYLCLHRWFGGGRLPRNGDFPSETTRGLAKMTLWLHNSSTGIRDELVLVQQEQSAWPLVRSGREYLDGLATCRYAQQGYCFVSRSHERAKAADVVVTTHAALLDYLTGGDEVLTQATHLLILDAHLLEEEAFRYGSYGLEHPRLKRLLDELLSEPEDGHTSGLLLLAARELERAQSAVGGRGALPAEGRVATWQALLEEARQAVERFFGAQAMLLSEQGVQGKGTRGPEMEASLRIGHKLRQTSGWKGIAESWAGLEEALLALTKRLEQLVALLQGAADTSESQSSGAVSASGGADDLGVALAVEISGLSAQVREMLERGKLIITQPQRDMVYWVKPTLPPLPPRSPASSGYQPPQPDALPPAPLPPSLHAAPTHAGPLLQQMLFHADRATVLVDTALTVEGQFDFTGDHLGFLPDRALTLTLAPEGRAETLLYLPDDVAEPNTSRFQRHLDDLIIRLATALNGDTVVMCASHAALRACYAGIKATLEERDILVLAQGIDGSIRQIWQPFRTQGRTVILGAGSFWEHQEFPGESPACLVIPRLPFPPLSDPPLAARADGLQDQLRQFVLPQATLKIRQGLNRLAWSSTRRNAIVLFDKRVQDKDYGTIFQHSLPRCTVRQGSASLAPEQVADWMRGEESGQPNAGE